jgi:carnitine 3-dehydrogenase
LTLTEGGTLTEPTLPDVGAPLELARLRVVPSWLDYNGHMTEGRYLLACSEVTDVLLRMIGVDLAYVAAGRSYYTVETHIMHLGESKLGDLLTGRLQVLYADEKRLHVFVMFTVEDRKVASLEQMLLHVDAGAGKATPADPAVLERLRPITAAHAALPRPESVGRHVGERR